ncbi:MAG: aldo/keto reductase [Methanobacteriaceae archaeon]|nr:aldo/keto reductase [Methanobacteriaceae archaeon]
MQELILGTAQLGLLYGVNNKKGKPNKEESFKILEYAYNNGIRILDTASGYGESEKIIGEYSDLSGNQFEIITKLGSIDESREMLSFLNQQINNSLYNLGKKCIEIYLIHNFNDLIYNKNLINESRCPII